MAAPTTSTTETVTLRSAIKSPESKKRRSCVSFAPKVFVKDTLHIKDYTPQEKRNSWGLTQRRKKRVSFNNRASCKTCRHINDYRPKEIERSWYSDEEYNAMKIECIELAEEFTESGFSCYHGMSANGVDSFRGLEGFTVEGNAKRNRIRDAAWDAVLDEQELQWDSDIVDADLIADHYYLHSEYAQIRAHMKGLRDEVDARDSPKKNSRTKNGASKPSVSPATPSKSPTSVMIKPTFRASLLTV